MDIIPQEYANVIYYLTKGNFPNNYSDKQIQRPIFKGQSYIMIGGVIYKKDKDEVLKRCINPSEVPLIFKRCHDDISGGHFAVMITTQKLYK